MIGVITDPGIGGTFLTWSVHYLRGDSSYFLVEKNKEIELTTNPLTDINAHNFIPNQPNHGPDRGLKKLYTMIDQLSKNKSNQVIYMCTFTQSQDTKSGVDCLCKHSDRTILISSKNCNLYHIGVKSRAGGDWNDQGQWIEDQEQINNNFIKKYFSDSKKIWQEHNLNDIWDQREFIALNFDQANVEFIEDYVDPSHDVYYLHALELFNFESHIQSVFDYLETAIDCQRHDAWIKIYQKWKVIYQSRLLFAWYFDQIIDSILNNRNFDLARFNLDLYQEAMIQRCLIYKHNLNLKTWQLEKFKNTKQLHNLLEPNLHPITQ
jgi:hypothetical protein